MSSATTTDTANCGGESCPANKPTTVVVRRGCAELHFRCEDPSPEQPVCITTPLVCVDFSKCSGCAAASTAAGLADMIHAVLAGHGTEPNEPSVTLTIPALNQVVECMGSNESPDGILDFISENSWSAIQVCKSGWTGFSDMLDGACAYRVGALLKTHGGSSDFFKSLEEDLIAFMRRFVHLLDPRHELGIEFNSIHFRHSAISGLEAVRVAFTVPSETKVEVEGDLDETCRGMPALVTEQPLIVVAMRKLDGNRVHATGTSVDSESALAHVPKLMTFVLKMLFQVRE